MSYVSPPVPIQTVLDAALKALSSDDRFRSVPNGRIEIAWRQPRKAKNGEGPSPGRYAITVEASFQDTRES